MQAMVDSLVALLGLQKVGWIFSHPAREKGFVLLFCHHNGNMILLLTGFISPVMRFCYRRNSSWNARVALKTLRL